MTKKTTITPQLIRCPNCMTTIPNPQHHDPFVENLANATLVILATVLAIGAVVSVIAFAKWVI